MTTRQCRMLVATVIGCGSVSLDGSIVTVALSRIGAEPPARGDGATTADG